MVYFPEAVLQLLEYNTILQRQLTCSFLPCAICFHLPTSLLRVGCNIYQPHPFLQLPPFAYHHNGNVRYEVQSHLLATCPGRPLTCVQFVAGHSVPVLVIQSHETPHLRTVSWLSWSSSTTTDEQQWLLPCTIQWTDLTIKVTQPYLFIFFKFIYTTFTTLLKGRKGKKTDTERENAWYGSHNRAWLPISVAVEKFSLLPLAWQCCAYLD